MSRFVSGPAAVIPAALIPALILPAVLLAGCLKVNVPEGAFLYPDARIAAEKIDLPVGGPFPAGSLDLSVTSADGRTVAATRAPGDQPPGAQRALVLFCGGNMFRRSSAGAATVRRLSAFGDVIVFDYPGYGGTPGPASFLRFRAAGEAVADQARDLARAEGRRLIAWGHSLGGPVCAEVARRASADALVLEATTPDARSAVMSAVGPMRLFARINIAPALQEVDVVRSLDGYDGRVVVLEAGKDDVLPARLSRLLEQRLRAEDIDVVRLAFPAAGHSDIKTQPDFVPRVSTALSN